MKGDAFYAVKEDVNTTTFKKNGNHQMNSIQRFYLHKLSNYMQKRNFKIVPCLPIELLSNDE